MFAIFRFSGAVFSALALGTLPHAAYAGCGLNPVCAVSEAIGRGVGGGAAEGLKPVIDDVMEREAPQLIDKLQGAVDHNIMTADQAGERLIKLASDVINDAVNNAAERGAALVAFTQKAVMASEQKLFDDLNRLVSSSFDRLNCEILGANVLISNQQQNIVSNIQEITKHVPFFSGGRSKIERSCLVDLGLPENTNYSSLELPTTFKLWRCVRLSLVTVTSDAGNASSASILNAYEDVGVHGFGVVCAMGKASLTATADITQIWNDDDLRAKAWRTAISEK